MRDEQVASVLIPVVVDSVSGEPWHVSLRQLISSSAHPQSEFIFQESSAIRFPQNVHWRAAAAPAAWMVREQAKLFGIEICGPRENSNSKKKSGDPTVGGMSKMAQQGIYWSKIFVSCFFIEAKYFKNLSITNLYRDSVTKFVRLLI